MGRGVKFVSGSARVLGIAVIGMAMVLLLMQSMLYVRTGWGIEDFLGWADDSPAGPGVALLELWRNGRLTWLAWAYLATDSVLFVPIYAAFFLKTGRLLVAALERDAGRPSTAGSRWFALLWVPVLMLVAVDLLENFLGLYRIGALGLSIALVTLVLGLEGVRRTADLHAWQVRVQLKLVLSGLVVLVLLLAVLFFSDACAAVESASWRGRLGCSAHRAKPLMIVLVLFLLVAGGICWLFGALIADPGNSPGNRQQAMLRANLRSAIFDCMVRSRYVLLALVLLAGMTVIMDQSRDVIASAASSVPRIFELFTGGGSAAPVGPGADRYASIALFLGSMLVFSLSALALALLVFACWLWTRSVCHLRSAGGRPPVTGLGYSEPGERHEDTFARDWARVLALVPVLLVVLLCADVLQDIAKAQAGLSPDPHAGTGPWTGLLASLGVVAFAVLAVFGGGSFIWLRGEQASRGGYYDCIDWAQWRERAGLLNAMPKAGPWLKFRGGIAVDMKYNFLGKITPYLLPIVALVLLLLCRLVDAWPGRTGDYVPSMALPIIFLSLTVWLCFFGWLSLLEVYRAVPWVLVLIGWAGVLGLLGLTDNHIVWMGPLPGEPSAWGAVRMLACTTLLAGVILVAYHWTIKRVRNSGDSSKSSESGNAGNSGKPGNLGSPASPGRRGGVWFLMRLAGFFLALTAVIMAGNFLATNRRPAETMAAQAAPAVPLDVALAGWLRKLCGTVDNPEKRKNLEPCAPSIAPNPATGGYDVYFVSSEGGGIRAAVWTAIALHRLEMDDPGFETRTFSISGVSGGAIGAAVYRACGNESAGAKREACIAGFADTDLLSPLVSSWMFEDLLGRLVPSGICRTPGCGFMSRGAWFEQAMEVGAPRLRKGMRELRRDDTRAGRHVPYLLLNATWVETGERAIASELVLSQADFPASKDQLALVGADMPLGAAAHNAARFPYVNAIGGLKTPAYLCDHRGTDVPVAPDKGSPGAETRICGHLADGGYFDNGGAQTTADLVRAFDACLTVAFPESAPAAGNACASLPTAHRTWLRENLVPRVLMIRNEADPGAAVAKDCGEISQPTRAQVVPPTDNACTTAIGERYRPARPVCAGGKTPYLDLIGPLLALINTSGIGASGRLAEARLGDAVVQARRSLGGVAAAATTAAVTAPVTAVDLLPKGVHFPLGWHLSRGAVDNMQEQAEGCSLGGSQ